MTCTYLWGGGWGVGRRGERAHAIAREGPSRRSADDVHVPGGGRRVERVVRLVLNWVVPPGHCRRPKPLPVLPTRRRASSRAQHTPHREASVHSAVECWREKPRTDRIGDEFRHQPTEGQDIVLQKGRSGRGERSGGLRNGSGEEPVQTHQSQCLICSIDVGYGVLDDWLHHLHAMRKPISMPISIACNEETNQHAIEIGMHNSPSEKTRRCQWWGSRSTTATQEQSRAIKGDRTSPSEKTRCCQWWGSRPLERKTVRATLKPLPIGSASRARSEAIRGNERQSEAMRGNERP